MSTLRYIRRWISRKPLEIEALLIQRTTNRKWHTVYQMVAWPMTSRDPKVLWWSTVNYPSDSLASCYVYWRRRALLTICTTGLVRVQTVETYELAHFSVITKGGFLFIELARVSSQKSWVSSRKNRVSKPLTKVWHWRFLKNTEIA